jgi:hypothetical protein
VICRGNAEQRQKEEGKIKKWLICLMCSCVPSFLIRLSVSCPFLPFFTFEILHLPRTGIAIVVRPLFDQFLGRHSVKGNNCPIGLRIYDWTVPDIRRD